MSLQRVMVTIKADDEFLRRNSIGFLRLVLASLVVLYHSFVLAGETPPGHMYAKLAVSGFFFLSGVLITQSFFHSTSPWDYLWRRTLRIFPGYWGCLVVSAFVITPIALWLQHGPIAISPSVNYVIHGFPMIGGRPSAGDVFAHTPYGNVMNGSLWTLPLEYICYLVVGFAGVLGVLKRKWLLLAVAALFYVWQVFPATRLPRIPHMPTSLSVPEVLEPYLMFALGALTYSYRDKIRLPWWLGPLGVATVIFIFAFELPDGWFQTGSAIVRVFALPIGLLWLAEVLPLREFGKKHDLSYGTYIYSFPIQQCLMVAFGFTGWALFGVSYVLTLAMAYLSWKLIEGPAMRYKKMFAKKRPAASLVPQPEVA